MASGLAGRIWVIGRDLSVRRLTTPYAAIGDGRLVAYGALAALTRDATLTASERAELAIGLAARSA